MRFLDNFSAGTRGASSAEHFLRSGRYAVIFLHRQHSLQPFSRHYSHSTNPFLDLLDVVDGSSAQEPGPAFTVGKGKAPEFPPPQDGHLFPPIPSMHSPPTSPRSRTVPLDGVLAQQEHQQPGEDVSIQIRPQNLTPMLSLLRSYKLVQHLNLLHSIPFVTVSEYLWLLRGISRVMGQARDADGKALGRRGMYYLAAAVSDFFIPYTKMVRPSRSALYARSRRPLR